MNVRILHTEQSLGVGSFILMLDDICQLNQVDGCQS
jgi:hypothetical protein